MLTQNIINEVKENMISNCIIMEVAERGLKDQCKLVFENDAFRIIFNDKYYLVGLMDNIEGKVNRKKAAAEFLNMVSLNDIIELYFQKKEEKIKKENMINSQLYKLEAIYNKYKDIITELNGNIEIVNKYLDIYFKLEVFNSANYSITIKDPDHFITYGDIYTLEELYKELDNNIEIAKEYRKQQAIKEAEEMAQLEKEATISNTIFKLIKENNTLLFKNNRSYFIYKSCGLRYSVGSGKAGKYMNCNYSKLIDMILKKNINDYIITDKTSWTDEELKEVQFNKIY